MNSIDDNKAVFMALVEQSLKRNLLQDQYAILESNLIEYRICLIEILGRNADRDLILKKKIEQTIAIVKAKITKEHQRNEQKKIELGIQKDGNTKSKRTIEDVYFAVEETNALLSDIITLIKERV